jgi:hypothetical protein
MEHGNLIFVGFVMVAFYVMMIIWIYEKEE